MPPLRTSSHITPAKKGQAPTLIGWMRMDKRRGSILVSTTGARMYTCENVPQSIISLILY
jgi:hypothetical protein